MSLCKYKVIKVLDLANIRPVQ